VHTSTRLAELELTKAWPGRLVACCVIEDARGWHVFAELERRTGRDRRHGEKPPADSLELFWRAERSTAERRQTQQLERAIEVADERLRQEVVAFLQVRWPEQSAHVRFFVPYSLPRTADGSLERHLIEQRLGASHG
jgi:hypothetical protein